MGATSPPTDQPTLCADAQAALARGNPAAPGLMQKCGDARAANIAAGVFIVDSIPPDAAMRVVLTDTGKRIIDKTPKLATAYASLDSETQRGFSIGVKVANASQAYIDYVQKSLASNVNWMKGFALGVAAKRANDGTGGAVQAPAGPTASGKILGMPTPVAIGVGVGVLGIAGLIAYKYMK